MESMFDKWWKQVQRNKPEKSKYLAKKAWVMATKLALLNIYDEKPIREELMKIKSRETHESQITNIKFLHQIRKEKNGSV